MSKIKKGYKYCIVPMCKSTLIKTPNKVFFYVPLQNDERKKWCKAMMRDVIGPKSKKYVCEDHFDLEKDMANYVKYKLVGGPVKLKDGVVPHKFDCQNNSTDEMPKLASPKKRKAECHEKILPKSIPVSPSTPKAEFADCGRIENISEDNPKETNSKTLKINANIIGYNVNGICVGCLNYNRKMYFHEYVNDCFKLLGNIEMPKGVSVQMCWECLAAVRTVRRFQCQILRSYDILINYSNKSQSTEEIPANQSDLPKNKLVKRKVQKIQHPFSNSSEHLTSHATSRLSMASEIEQISTNVDKRIDNDAMIKMEQNVEQSSVKSDLDGQIETKDNGFFYEDYKRNVSLLDNYGISKVKRKKPNLKEKKNEDENSVCVETNVDCKDGVDFEEHFVSNSEPLNNIAASKVERISTSDEPSDYHDVVKNEREDPSFNVEQHIVKIELEIEENGFHTEDHNQNVSSQAKIKEENHEDMHLGDIESNPYCNEVVSEEHSVSNIVPANNSHFAYEVLENVIKSSRKTSLLLINRGGSLNTKQKYLLSKVIAKEILKYSRTGLIRHETYNKWTQAIIQVFPGERYSTYFIPGCKSQGVTKPPRGMLVRECVKRRRKLKQLIARERIVNRVRTAQNRNIKLETED